MSENIGKIFIKKFCTNNTLIVVTSSTIQSNYIDRFELIGIFCTNNALTVVTSSTIQSNYID